MGEAAKVGSVTRVLELLQLVGSADRPRGVTELARGLGVHKSVVSRLCQALKQRGFLEVDPDTGKYVLGLKILELAGRVRESITVRNVALPVMTDLTARTGEASFLNVLRENACVCVEKVESPQVVRVTYEVGRHAPLTAGAPAKLLLAYAGDAFVERVLREGLPRFTPHTVTDPEVFKKQLEGIKEQGWAFSVGELTPDVAALAAPVWDRPGRVCAALCIAGPAYRFTPEVLPGWRSEVVAAARRVSDVLCGNVAELAGGYRSSGA
ncbi:MAG: IclR family transcriptional regulator [Bacillota bacterium]